MDETTVTVTLFIVTFFIFGVALFSGLILLRSRGSSGPFGTLLAFGRARRAPTPQRRRLELTPRRSSGRAAR